MLRVNAGYVNIYYLVGKHGGKMNIEQGKCSFEPICWWVFTSWNSMVFENGENVQIFASQDRARKRNVDRP